MRLCLYLFITSAEGGKDGTERIAGSFELFHVGQGTGECMNEVIRDVQRFQFGKVH